jgi:hypothetical protein
MPPTSESVIDRETARASVVPLWLRRYLYRLIARYLGFFTPAGARILEVGPMTRLLKDALPDRQVLAYRPDPEAGFSHAEVLPTFEDAVRFAPERIVLNGVLHVERDIQARLEEIHTLCTPSTRVLIVYYSSLWKPVFRVARALGLQTKGPDDNWISPSDAANLLALAQFEVVTSQPRVLLPVWIPLVSDIVNRWLAPLPVANWFALLNVVVARPRRPAWATAPSVSVVVPARNEAGNIEALIERLPAMGPADELIVVEGHSTDNTWAVLESAVARHPERDITILRQKGRGKGDAVRTGFAVAKREILMILDADMTVPPEDLRKFYRARVSDVGEFVNGTRLVYPLEAGAMQFANIVGNKFFALAFSFLVGQPVKDTLCGTKVIDRTSYEQLHRDRAYFGDFDPFGDFDLLFGAQRLGLKYVELPIRYQSRSYGSTNIQRWRHGWLLLRMTLFAARRVKFI